MPGLLFGSNFLNGPVTGQKRPNLFAIEPTICCDLSQRIEIPDIASLREVGEKERLNHLILTTLLSRKPNKPMGIEGIRRPDDPIESKLNPLCFASLGHPTFHCLQSLGSAEFRFEIGASIQAFLRHRRIQFKGSPQNLSQLGGSDLLERLF